MDPMTAARKIRMHVDMLERKEFKEGGLHICFDCLNYVETPILWYHDYRFYPYCTDCMIIYYRMDKIDSIRSRIPKRIYVRNGSRT